LPAVVSTTFSVHKIWRGLKQYIGYSVITQ
jgi:hypothetical protein